MKSTGEWFKLLLYLVSRYWPFVICNRLSCLTTPVIVLVWCVFVVVVLVWCVFVVVLVGFLGTSRFFFVVSSDCLFSLPCWCNLPYMFLSLLLQLASQWTPWQLALFPTAVSCLPAAFYHFACILVITNRLLRLLFGALVIPCWFYHLFPADLLLNSYFVLYPVLILDFWLWDSINQIQDTFSRNFQSV